MTTETPNPTPAAATETEVPLILKFIDLMIISRNQSLLSKKMKTIILMRKLSMKLKDLLATNNNLDRGINSNNLQAIKEGNKLNNE
jgi:hypothetical protein